MKLEDVAIGIYDGPHATPPPCDKAGYYFLGIPQITPAGHIDLSNPRYISKADYAKWTKRVVPCEGDVVFSYEATLNLYAMIPKDKRCCLGRRMGLVRPDTAKLDARFLYYYFFSPEWRKTVMENTVVGATVDRLPIKTFPSFKISLPPLPVQRRIADILSAYDDLIENNRRRIAILEETARLTYRKWFGGVEQCGTATLGEIAPFVRGKVITLKNAVHGKVPVVAGGLEPAYFHNVANTGAPVITISGSGANAGFTRMYFEPIWVSDCSWCDKAKAKWFYFAYCFLKDNADALQNLQQGAAQPHVYPKDINALEVALPKSDDLLDNFEESVEPLFSQCGVLAKQNTALAIVREMLLPRLMKGEVA